MEWFEDESFWRDFYPYMFDEARWAKAFGQVESVLRLAGIDQGEVLDLCCGPGRHCVAFAKKGLRVTGVDRSAFLLEHARRHAEGSTVEFVHSDARDFARDGAFDLVVNLFTSFGYFATREEDLRMLRSARRSPKPGGVLVVDLHGTETIALLKTLTVWKEDPKGKIVIMHAEPLDEWQRMRNSWVLLDGERARRFEFTLNLYSGTGLTKMLETARASAMSSSLEAWTGPLRCHRHSSGGSGPAPLSRPLSLLSVAFPDSCARRWRGGPNAVWSIP